MHYGLIPVAGRKDSASADEGQSDIAAKTATNLKGAMGQRIQKALQKVEDKKRKRAARKAQWDELYEKKPGRGENIAQKVS